jgi:hypothetical protein
MAVNAATFVAQFPEFEEIYALTAPVADGAAIVNGALLEAQAYCSATVWGDRYERGVFTKAAHILCMSAFGENARIDAKAATAYGVKFQEMVRALPMRVLVSGGFGGCF